MSDLTRIEQNNAELQECIEIAESLPNAPETVNGYDIATMQKFVDGRGLNFLYYNCSPKLEDLQWLTEVDTSKITETRYMFENAFSVNCKTVPLFDVSNVTDASHMFYGGSYPESIPAFHFKQPCNCENMFSGSGYRTYFTECNVIIDDCTNAKYMFSYCSKLEKIPEGIKTHNCKTFDYMFQHCQALKGNISIDMTSGTYARYFLQGGGNTRGNELNVEFKNSSQLSDISRAFYGTTALVTFSADLKSVTGATYTFDTCKALTNLTIKNIKTTLQVGSGTSWGHLLTVDSLVGLCYELRDTGSVKTLTVGSANLEKLASVYVREITITDEMRAEDDLIDEKLPFERCESTDDGATLIADYVLLKNWKLA